MKICYVPKTFRGESLTIIEHANDILDEYAAQGFVLTLRQLYYQFVARDILPNSQKSYTRLGGIINDARLAGLIDWQRLEDRTRNLQTLEHFDGPGDALQKLASWYHVDMWAAQEYRPEVWIEKDALVGVIERVCRENDVPYFSCRGYTSQSEMWRAGIRFKRYLKHGQIPYLLHFGDHDPSGIDMSRDIRERIQMFIGGNFDFERLALNMEQIEEFNPPPNPAKTTDSRYASYIEDFGYESWELDALEPQRFRVLIEDTLAILRDAGQWTEDLRQKKEVKARLQELADSWEEKP